VFKLTPSAEADPNWELTVVHSLRLDDGERPVAGLMSDGSGAGAAVASTFCAADTGFRESDLGLLPHMILDGRTASIML
jgi:hypothetical protein